MSEFGKAYINMKAKYVTSPLKTATSCCSLQKSTGLFAFPLTTLSQKGDLLSLRSNF